MSLEPEAEAPAGHSLRYYINALAKYNASDLHLKSGRPPLYRINGKLVAAKMPPLTEENVQELAYETISDEQVKELEKKRQIDFSFHVKDVGRFRCNIYYQRGAISAAIRMIPFTIPSLETLGMPLVLKELVQKPRGLFLVTGATGCGKSTTLASLVQFLNETTHIHILIIEDPTEFVYKDIKASISQREIGSDALSLEEALFAGLRQDPDVIVISELRDYKMIQGALTAAETGHLVIATLHTNDAKSTIDRIIDVFPPEAKNQVRIQLASSLIGVSSQQLLLRKDGKGLVPACEIMIKSPSIAEYILKNQLEKIPDAISTSSTYYKMQSMNLALEKLVKTEVVTAEEALKASNSPDDLALRLAGMVKEIGYGPQFTK